MKKLTIGENEAGQRLDRFLRKYLRQAPLSAVYRIIRKDLKVNGRRAKKDAILAEGDELTLYLSEEQECAFAKATPARTATARKQFRVVYEDEAVLIVNKPAGLLTHGDRKEKSNTLVNQVCGYLQEKGEYDPAKEKTFRPAPVNRLDRNTTGLVIFGKTAPALRLLTAVLREREQVRKFYRTILCGRLTEERLVEDALVKDRVTNTVRIAGSGGAAEATDSGRTAEAAESAQAACIGDVIPAGEKAAGAGDMIPAGAKAACTRVRPIRAGRDFTLAEVELLTGRTHQIRVHMAGIGHPLAADPRYGDEGINARLKKHGIRTQLLHAGRLEFASMPEGLESLSDRTVEADPPAAFLRAERELIHE